jgi:hypothetical protein
MIKDLIKDIDSRTLSSKDFSYKPDDWMITYKRVLGDDFIRIDYKGKFKMFKLTKLFDDILKMKGVDEI